MESKDIFARLAAAEDKSSQQGETGDKDDSFLVVVGPKNSGKTSLVMYFLNPNKLDEPKPTAALDYVYARRAVPGSNRKAVAHIWELASSKKVLDLLKVPLSPERLPKSALMLVLDLSAPGEVVPSLVYWVNLIRKLLADTPSGFTTEQALAKYGSTHPDRREVSPIPLPLLIVGSKYDTFRDEDSVKRKGLVQAVRYIAHSIGATVVFTSVKDKALATQFRATLSAAVYSTEAKTTKEVEKGLFIPAGTDTFEEIGLPKGARPADLEDANWDKRMRLWTKAAAELYASNGVKETADEEEKDEAEDKFPEPTIDALRKQKREELRRYKEKKTEKKPAKKEAKD
ncbi:unnamed protein product [Aphanomyces euteiches]|nr:hypothetical protein Ae201684P_003045 [Aphanomyces euteiches]